jgi:hypothetical protein
VGAAVFPSRAPRPAAEGELPAGAYDRVLVAAPRVRGEAANGRAVSIASYIEPIALPFALAPGAAATIDIRLIVLPAASGPAGTYEIFVRDATLREEP